jgi:L(+)-tartrate dehydratase beta subunit
MRVSTLSIPLTIDDVRALKIGSLVNLSGLIYTCRGLFHRRVIDENKDPPFDTTSMNVMMHTGPVVVRKNGEWHIMSIQPTTSNRYEKWGSKIIKRLGIRVIIGKGTMGNETAETMKEFGCIHLTALGVAGALLPKKAKVKTVKWFDLGPIEATWIFEVKDFGPFMVDIDMEGNRYFSTIKEKIDMRLPRIYEKLGIPKNFEYANLSFD